MMQATVHPFERRLLIRFSHCDPAGIVFFPQYLVMVNNLIEDWVSEALNIPYAALIGTRRIGLPTVSLNCEFTAVSRMGDEVMLGLTLAHTGRSSVRLELGCRQGDEQRMRVTQTIVATDLNTHRPLPLPDDLRKGMTAFQQS